MLFTYRRSLMFLSLFLFASANELDYDGWLQVQLWHSTNLKSQSVYQERGNITISSVRSGSAIVTQPALSQTTVTEINALAKNMNKYKLKATVKTSSGSEITFLTSALACNLVGSNLQDTLNIWLDNAGDPVALNLVANGPCVQSEQLNTDKWITDVQIKYPDSGPIPDTATYIQKLEREKLARESGEVKDNRSFFAKYWMYIIPALIFFVLTSATNPEAGSQGGGGGGAVQRQ